jgi:sulfofructosephosphate aldolase
VDVLEQERGAPVEETSLDEEPALVAGVVALKLLVIWRDDERRAQRVEMSRRFVELAERHGLLSVLEPVVRVPDADREDAIVEAARELGAVRPSLYKCQVPLAGRGPAEEIEALGSSSPTAAVQSARPARQPDAPPRQAASTARGKASGSTPCDSTTHGTGRTASMRRAWRVISSGSPRPASGTWHL